MPAERSRLNGHDNALALQLRNAVPSSPPLGVTHAAWLGLMIQQIREVVRYVDNAGDAVHLARRANAVDKLVDEALKSCQLLQEQQFELRQDAAEAHLRTMRRAGQLLARLRMHAGGRPPQADRPRPPDGDGGAGERPVTLREVGISAHESHRWQRIARLPDGVFEAHLHDCREHGRELTTAGVLLLAKRYAQEAGTGEEEEDEEPGATRPSGAAALLREYGTAKDHIANVIWLDPIGLVRGMDSARRAEELACLRRWRIWIEEFEAALTTDG